MAAGGKMQLTSYSVGGDLPVNGSCPTAVIAGSSLTFTDGQAMGNIVAGGIANVTYVSQPPGCNVTSGDTAAFDFAGAAANLKV